MLHQNKSIPGLTSMETSSSMATRRRQQTQSLKSWQSTDTDARRDDRDDVDKLTQRQQRSVTVTLLVLALFGFVVLAIASRKENPPYPILDLEPFASSRSTATSKSIKKQYHSSTTNNDGALPARPTPTRLLSEGLPPTAKILKLAPTLDTCPHTMVTAYFKVSSKYPAEKYMEWMANLLSVQDCMVIFTSPDFVEPITNFRNKHAASKTVIVEMNIDDLPISRMGPEFWQHQLDIDAEKTLHKSYKLFWIWLSKSWCVVQAIKQNYFASSQIFMWQDIGSFRVQGYNGKLIIAHPEQVIPPKTIVWMAHHSPVPPPDPIWNNKLNKKEKRYYFHSGSQGAGDAATWFEFHGYFAQTMEQFLARDMFIGEDQCILQSTCQLHPSLCAYLGADQVKDNFYFGLRYALNRGGSYKLWRMPDSSVPSDST